ncbi:MAG: molybdopterin oxidoreductase family protein, partial [Myxococcota bacterium]
VYTLFDEGLVRDGRLTDVTSGRDVIERATRPFSPERVADACGLTSTAIRDLARAFARAERAVCYARIGTCTQQFGSLATWLVDVLNALTNNLDEPGGAMFSMAAHEPRRPERSAGGRGFEIGRWNSRIYDAPEVLGEFPVATLNDEIRTSGEGQIKALLTVAGNPVLSTPNGPALAESLAQLNFMVSIDPYLNETTRHAHVILPPPPPLTRSHYDISFYGFALRRVANFSAPVWAAAPEAMPEWQIVMGLVGRLSGQTTEVEAVDDFLCRQMVSKEVNDKRSPLHGRSVDALMKELGDRRGPDRMIDFLLRAGVYGDGFGADPDGLSLDKLLAHPHGIDFGPLVPRLPDMLTTKSGRIELAPPLLLKDLDRLAQQLDETPPELVLIGRRHLRSNNSWMHNVPGLMTGRPRCTALIHPDDAAKAGVSDGEQAQLRSSTGTISVIVEIDEAIRPGVVSVPHGWGHDDEQTRLSVARQTPGTNVNELASTEAWDPLSGNAILNGVPVALTALC